MRYAKPSEVRAIFQIVNTLIPYLMGVFVMYYMVSKGVNVFWVLLFSLVPALFIVRIFILFHDCVHGSFMRSKRMMNILGSIFGVLTCTPYVAWKNGHLIHHSTSGNLDRRGIGDIWTVTVKEFDAFTPLKKCLYRIYRSPVVLIFVGSLFVFLIHNRYCFVARSKAEMLNLIFTNVVLLGVFLLVSLTIGIKFLLLIQLPCMLFAGAMGIWLFYVQHQYEEAYWEHAKNWSFIDSALKGGSFYKLPAVFNWFSANIGYHNVHHFNPFVPNYNLVALYDRHSGFRRTAQIRFLESFALISLCLYDEDSRRLITYKAYKNKLASL